MNAAPPVAVTLGDPRGIGPEVMARAIAERVAASAGDRFQLFGACSEPLPTGPMIDASRVERWRGGDDPMTAGAVSLSAIEAAVSAVLSGAAGALVTGPIDKRALQAAGSEHPGHTELLGALTNARDVGMLMAAEHTHLGGPLRVLLATTHIALRDVARRLTPGLLVSRSRLVHTALRSWWKIPRPRIALCAVNPHASDGGLFGDEEERILAPAIALARDSGIDMIGPIPADTVFSRTIRGEFDAVVAPYHDVGMAAFKTASFGRGVNVTLGLPFPRTSPDHGTALDIAGQGVADHRSAAEAIGLAVRLARSFDTGFSWA